MLFNGIHRRGHGRFLKSCCYSSPVIESLSRATTVIAQPEAKLTELMLVAVDIKTTEADIQRTVAEIREAEADIRSATTSEEKAYYREKARQLRKKEGQLRTKEERLHTEKKQKEELERTQGGCTHPISLRLLHDFCACICCARSISQRL
jgi:DNA repair exonuclease SbcCD ATPase subunit